MLSGARWKPSGRPLCAGASPSEFRQADRIVAWLLNPAGPALPESGPRWPWSRAKGPASQCLGSGHRQGQAPLSWPGRACLPSVPTSQLLDLCDVGSALLRPPLSQHGLGFLPESRAVRNLSPQASTSDGQMPSGASHGCRTASTAVGNTGFQTRLGPGGLCKQWGSQASVLHGHRAGVHPNRRPTRDGRALPAGCSPGSTAVASGATRGGADPGERLPSWGRGDPPTTWFVPRSTLSSKCPTAPPPWLRLCQHRHQTNPRKAKGETHHSASARVSFLPVAKPSPGAGALRVVTVLCCPARLLPWGMALARPERRPVPSCRRAWVSGTEAVAVLAACPLHPVSAPQT